VRTGTVEPATDPSGLSEHTMIRAIRRLWGRANLDHDRRRACRYPIADAPVFLGWWQAEQFRTTTAMLMDLSMQGASVRAQEAPGAGPVWLCPCHAAPSQWAEARVVAVERGGGSLFRRGVKVRLEFVGPCSYELFKSGTGTRYTAQPESSADDAAWCGYR
jgi:hypothetical protein